MLTLNSIQLSGFKSIDSEGQKIEFGNITVLIGANGSGKSNLVSFFKMLNYMTTDALESFTNKNNNASSFLYFGPKRTPVVQAEITFTEGSVRDFYRFSLAHASGDIFLFTKNEIGYHEKGHPAEKVVHLGVGTKESHLKERLNDQRDNKVRSVIYKLLKGCLFFQFHDTSPTANIRGLAPLSHDSYLYDDGGNLAALLYAMAKNQDTAKYYERIVSHVKAVFPQFQDFVLEEAKRTPRKVELKWRSNEGDYVFGPHQISDGSIRFMALATLLLQPPQWLPNVIIIDEPELGLHPSAISDLATMVKTASKRCQVILATQSPRLLDEFTADVVVVVEQDESRHRSLFKRLQQKDLTEWIDRYSMSELWEKNVLGGTP